MIVLMLCRNKCSQVLNEGLFCFKYLLVVGVFIGLLFVDNSVFEDYAIASKYISIIYMILQSIILIDLFYMFSIKLVKRYDQGETCYGGYLIFFTILFEAGAIFLNIYGYVRFSSTDDGQCTSLTWLNVITSIILVILPLFQICQFNTQNSLLTASLVSLYISYLSFIAQFSYDGLCKYQNLFRFTNYHCKSCCRHFNFNFHFLPFNVRINNGRIRTNKSYIKWRCQ